MARNIYASFAPSAVPAKSEFPTPGRRRIVQSVKPLAGIAVLDGRDYVRLLAADRVSARSYLLSEGRE